VVLCQLLGKLNVCALLHRQLLRCINQAW
jgi:hypothetical protein